MLRMLFSMRRTILEVISWLRKVDQPQVSQLLKLVKKHLANVSSTPKSNTPGLPLILHEYGESSGTLGDNKP